VQGVVELTVAGAESRCRTTSPKDTSIGATPQNEANAAEDGKRLTEPVRARSLAASTSPTPSSRVRLVPEAVTATVTAAVASAMRRSSRRS